ncbi:hypothetical protein KKF05_03255 [Patescibacteria group bacterium]|nr:hypothetical protein [Patescibacteria group bacterium]MBU1028873.1 hypothetical protein [Patescibacteria group bacterium]MBU1915634.1 hypothetical protein [Patescibacteria group bacterium]
MWLPSWVFLILAFWLLTVHPVAILFVMRSAKTEIGVVLLIIVALIGFTESFMMFNVFCSSGNSVYFPLP